jgi:proteasome lid subunit RPN8/RPN11
MRTAQRITGIAAATLEFILEVSKSTHPREFIGLLCAEGNLISEVVMLPGTLSTDESATMRRDMIPMGLSSVGSVHSHPHPGSLRPSAQDLVMFSKTGNYHIIVCYPYTWQSWNCYTARGERQELKIVEAEGEAEGAKMRGDEEHLW